jgi:hypothetical protein
MIDSWRSSRVAQTSAVEVCGFSGGLTAKGDDTECLRVWERACAEEPQTSKTEVCATLAERQNPVVRQPV